MKFETMLGMIDTIRLVFASQGAVGKANSPTWVMWDLMGELNDSDLVKMEIDISDVANEVLRQIEGKRY